METTIAFALGVLSVFFVAAVIILAWGIVRVIKLNAKLAQIEQRFENNFDSLWSENNKTRDYLDRSIAETHMQTDRRFEYLERDLNERFKYAHNTIGEIVRHCESYTDSRVDKMMNSKGRTLLKDDVIN